tara:strand:+ start:24473 stop:26044 length:1572 start_codon:yes stop_codon:yes gene_type:complete
MRAFIAVFDFDGTLIRGDATLRFLLLLRGPFGLIKDLWNLKVLIFSYLIQRCTAGEFKQKLLNKALLSTSTTKRKLILLEKLPYLLKKLLRPQAIKRLEWHKSQGHRCLIITASPEPLITSLAKDLNIELIGTGCNDPLLVGPGKEFLLTTPNCKGPEKLSRLNQYLGYMPLREELESYGDSRGDRELLKASKYPHHRSFDAKPKSYKEVNFDRWLIPALAMAIFFIGVNKLNHLDLNLKVKLQSSIATLLHWLPIFYSLLSISYLGRYLRWRFLLGSMSIGGWNINDALEWFRGFALSATPAKIGELSRVKQLNDQLGYPKQAILSVFFAERICDIGAVLIWVSLLLPQLIYSKVQQISGLSIIVILVVLIFIFFALKFQWLERKANKSWEIVKKNLLKRDMVKASFLSLVVSVALWGCEAMILWLLVSVLSPTAAITKGTAICIFLLSGTAGIASGLPGGIGVNEAATAIMLQQEGIATSTSIAIAILRRLITIWSITGLSIISSLPILKLIPKSHQNIDN